MKKHRRGILYSALALVLGAALLTSAIAAPQLRQHIATVQQEVQTRHMPATALLSSSAIAASVVDEHNVVWGTTSVDVFGVGQEFFKPGSAGSYEFTLYNHENFEVAYLFRLGRGDELRGNWQNIPMLYRLDGGVWAPYDEIEQDGVLLGGESRIFTLEWTWPFHIDDGQDNLDTDLGENHLYTWYQLELEIILEYDPPSTRNNNWFWLIIIPLFSIIFFIVLLVMSFVGLRVAGNLFCYFSENC